MEGRSYTYMSGRRRVAQGSAWLAAGVRAWGAIQGRRAFASSSTAQRTDSRSSRACDALSGWRGHGIMQLARRRWTDGMRTASGTGASGDGVRAAG